MSVNLGLPKRPFDQKSKNESISLLNKSKQKKDKQKILYCASENAKDI